MHRNCWGSAPILTCLTTIVTWQKRMTLDNICNISNRLCISEWLARSTVELSSTFDDCYICLFVASFALVALQHHSPYCQMALLPSYIPKEQFWQYELSGFSWNFCVFVWVLWVACVAWVALSCIDSVVATQWQQDAWKLKNAQYLQWLMVT